ncbi:cupin domain-containing protein [Streptomyces libani]|uniref:cupin domain-containing protein n=1 Tax=Streptomyces nigrescens TaxID=1920 RepID=UPI00363186CC
MHHHADEFVYVLEGAMEVDFDGTTHRLTPGMCDCRTAHRMPCAMPPSRPPGVCRSRRRVAGRSSSRTCVTPDRSS